MRSYGIHNALEYYSIIEEFNLIITACYFASSKSENCTKNIWGILCTGSRHTKIAGLKEK